MIKRPILKLYKYDNVKLAELHSAYSINEDKKFGEVNDLSFLYPKFLINRNKQTVLSDSGFPQNDDKADMLINERLILLNNIYYIIKQVSEIKTKDGFTVFEVICKEKYSELSYKQVYNLILNPPIHLPVFADEAIAETLSYPYEKMNGTVVASSSGTVTLDTTSTVNYTGDKIIIVENTGVLQDRRIVSYNTSTKIATLDSNWSVLPDTTSLYRIHNSQYKLGTIDPLLLNDGTSDILRGFEFQEISILDALLEISERFGGKISTTVTYNSTYNEYENVVNLVLSTSYSNVEFRPKKNLNGITRVVDSSSGCFTRLSPVGRNNLRINTVATVSRNDLSSSGLVTYNEHELGQSEMFNFQYYIADDYTVAQCKKNFVKDYKFVNEGYSDADLLYDGAKKSLEELSIPKVTYTIESLDLSVLENYAYLDYDIGQTVRVVDSQLNMSFYATVYKKTINYNNPQNPSIELSNFFDSFGGYLNRIIKYNSNFTQDKKKYGKGNTVIIADELTSRNWRYADYVIPANGRYTADKIIQKAIDDMSTNTNGGTIQLLEGTYYLNATLLPKDNITLQGSGISTRLVPFKDMGLCINITGKNNIIIKDLFIDYNRQSDGTSLKYRFSDGIGVYSGSDGVDIDNITIEYVNNNMFIAIDSSNLEIINSVFKSTDLVFHGTNVIDMKACINGSVNNCNIIGNIKTSYSVILLTEQVGDSYGTFFITNNYFDFYIGSGEVVIEIFLLDESSVIIENNKMNVREYCSTFIYAYGSPNILIQNNVIIGNIISYGIAAYGITGSVNNINIVNNQLNIRGAEITTGNGIGMEVSDAFVSGNSIKSNNIYNSANAIIYQGIKVIAGSTSAIISNNDLTGSALIPYTDLGTGTKILGGNSL